MNSGLPTPYSLCPEEFGRSSGDQRLWVTRERTGCPWPEGEAPQRAHPTPPRRAEKASSPDSFNKAREHLEITGEEKKRKNQLPYHPASPLLGIYSQN